MIAKTFLFLCLWLTCSAWGSVVHSSSFEITPDVKIKSPISSTDIAIIGDLTDVFITVIDDNVSQWTLHLIDQSVPNATPQLLFDGNTEQNNEKIGQLDPTLLENGIYALALSATDKGAKLLIICVKPIVLVHDALVRW